MDGWIAQRLGFIVVTVFASMMAAVLYWYISCSSISLCGSIRVEAWWARRCMHAWPLDRTYSNSYYVHSPDPYTTLLLQHPLLLSVSVPLRAEWMCMVNGVQCNATQRKHRPAIRWTIQSNGGGLVFFCSCHHLRATVPWSTAYCTCTSGSPAIANAEMPCNAHHPTVSESAQDDPQAYVLRT